MADFEPHAAGLRAVANHVGQVSGGPVVMAGSITTGNIYLSTPAADGMTRGRECHISVDVEYADSGNLRLRYAFGDDERDYVVELDEHTVEGLLDVDRRYRQVVAARPAERHRLLVDCGTALYSFLDTPRGLLTARRRVVGGSWDSAVLSLATGERFAHLPWELLHDGTQFLVAGAVPVVVVRSVARGGPARRPPTRPLRVLYMACSPVGQLPAIDYDAEHDVMMSLGRSYPLEPHVDDRGSLDGLADRLGEYEYGHFDVVHLSAHVGRSRGQVALATEGHAGEQVDVGVEAVQDALRGSGVSVLFVSGGPTGDTSTTAELAARLAGAPVPVVLGWTTPPGEVAATGAVAVFYRLLAQGRTVAEAVRATCRALLDRDDSSWHALRVFVAGDLPGAVVAAARSGNATAPARSLPHPVAGGRDDTWRGFVGRRRELQEAVRLLGRSADPDPVGVALCGMGGLGKTRLARQVEHRLAADYDVVRVERGLTEAALLQAIDGDAERGLDLLDVPADLSLPDRLTLFLRRHSQRGRKLLLFELDEFEHAFEPGDGGPHTINLVNGRPETGADASATLAALVHAVRTCGYGPHRILMTSRYVPDLPCLRHFAIHHLSTLGKPDLERLVHRLTGGAATLGGIDLAEVMDAAGDNTRLVEWMVKTAQHEVRIAPDALRAVLRQGRAEFLENDVFAPMLLDAVSGAERRVLEAAAPFRTPVPAAVLGRLCGTDIGDTPRRLADLGLLEARIGSGGDRFALPGVLRFRFASQDGDAAHRARHAAAARELAVELGDLNEIEDFTALDVPVVREVHRLARLGADLTLEVDTAVALAEWELFSLRFGEARRICEQMLVRLHDLGHRNHLLYVTLAEALLESGQPGAGPLLDKALEVCPPDAWTDRAGILSVRGFWTAGYLAGPALPALDEAIALARAHGPRTVLAFALRTKARMLAERREQGRQEQVPALLAEALDLVPGRGLLRAGVLLDRAISFHLPRGDIESAWQDLRVALAINEEVGTSAHQAVTLLTMADSALAAGHPDLAARCVEEASQRSTTPRVGIGCDLVRGDIELGRGSAVTARAHHESARARARGTGHLRQQLRALDGLRRVHALTGDRDAAERVRREQDRVAHRLQEPTALIGVLIESVVEERAAGTMDGSTAVARAREAATLASVADLPEHEIRAWQLFLDHADEAAVPAYELEAPLRRLLALLDADDRGRVAQTTRRLGLLLLRTERFAEARSALESALEHYERNGLHESVAEIHERLADVARGVGRSDAAQRHLRAATLRRLEVRSHGAAARTLRVLAAVQRDESPDPSRTTLRFARRLARLAPSGLLEGLVLLDQATSAAGDEATTLRRMAVAAELRSRAVQVDVATGLIGHVDPDQGGDFLQAVHRLRAEVETDSGWTLPRVLVTADDDLGPGRFVIRVWGDPVVEYEVGGASDPTGFIVAQLRVVTRTHRTVLLLPEPPPPFEAGVDECSPADIIDYLGGRP